MRVDYYRYELILQMCSSIEPIHLLILYEVIRIIYGIVLMLDLIVCLFSADRS